MYCVVAFVNSLDIRPVPVKFIKDFDPITIGNEAIDQSVTYVVFHSKDYSENPCFSLDLQAVFDESVPGCYEAKMLRFFRKKLFFTYSYKI